MYTEDRGLFLDLKNGGNIHPLYLSFVGCECGLARFSVFFHVAKATDLGGGCPNLRVLYEGWGSSMITAEHLVPLFAL